MDAIQFLSMWLSKYPSLLLKYTEDVSFSFFICVHLFV
jgi:hypothetical protein